MKYVVTARKDGKPKGYANVGRLFGCPYLEFGSKAEALKFDTEDEAQDLVKICEKSGYEAQIKQIEEE